jgi:predicted DNA-binding transcriptional regulator AlpA
MSPEDLSSEERAASAASPEIVTLSKWVNERFPPWEQLLSAHDVARLTRRPRWVLLGLTLLGRFPRKHCFHGRRIGWLRDDVLDWIGKGASFDAGRTSLFPPKLVRLDRTGLCAARRSRNSCSTRRADER